MSERFANAPLIELVVDVRWDAPLDGVVTAPEGDSGVVVDNRSDAFFDGFGAAFAREGFARSERLIPRGFPAPPNEAVFRYSKSDDASNHVFFHVGPTTFSVNAVPPYNNWDDFRETVVLGVETLVAVVGGEVPEFSRIGLRYIDAFGEDYFAESGRSELIDILGLKVQIPAALSRRISAPEEADVFVQYSAPLEDGRALSLRAGHATVSNSPSVVFDIAIFQNDATPSRPETVMTELDAAHIVIHESFLDMTQPVRSILEKSPHE